MITRPPDGVPPEWLAAYADGELTPRECERVENWLADNPHARESVETQESLGPINTEFWNSVRPPEPSPMQWAAVERNVLETIPVRPYRSWPAWIGVIGLVATAASLLFILLMPGRRDSHSPATPELSAVAEETDMEVYEMASPEDVQIISLPEAAANLLVVGEHPLQNAKMRFARFGEVEFYGIGSDLAGQFPSVPTEASPGEIPTIWAPRAP